MQSGLLDLAKGVSFVAATPVGDHYPWVVRWDYLLHLLVPVPGTHLVDRGLIGIKGYQVSILATHLPASVVGVDHWGVLYGGPQLLVGGTHWALGPDAGHPFGCTQDRPG
jgi:hypothetical protein